MKKLKKFLCVALVLLLLVASAPAVPVADLGFGITASALNATGKCGEDATYTFDSETGELVISGEGAIDECAFIYNTEIINVIIGDSITDIGSDAFKSSAIESVVIGNGVKTIGSNAFTDCLMLKNIEFSDYTQTIGDYAFAGCDSLETIDLPNSISDISYRSFAYCDSLSNVVISNNIISINIGAFEGCKKLKNVVIGNNVEEIWYDAFMDCTMLESIYIPKSIKSIKNDAFRHCHNLKYVYFSGTEEEWNKIVILENNTALKNATIHFGKTVETPAECEHNELTYVKENESTCISKGNKSHYICEACNSYIRAGAIVTIESITLPINPNNHADKVELKADTAMSATCTAPGKEADLVYKCCGVVKSVGASTPIIPHSIEGVTEFTKCDDIYHGKQCKYCDAVIARELHSWNLGEVTTSATCTSKGIKAFTCTVSGCTAIKTEEISSLGHNYVNGVCTRPDCGINCTHNWENGKCKYCKITCQHAGGTASCIEKATCTICGEKYGAFDPTNHTSTEVFVKNVKEATCHEPGYTGDIYHKCCDSLKQCGDTITVEHDYAITVSKKDDNTHGKKCTNCNSFTEIGIHDWELKATTTPPTCTADGVGVYECKDCNATKEEKINKLNHDTTGVAFEKINDTKHGKKCKLCNMIIEEANHAYTELVAKALPTCVTTGSETKKCVCGDTKTEVIPANDNHDWGAFTIIKAPTCTEKGEKARVCKRVGCTAKDSVEIILATEHTYSEEKIIIKTPTCKSEGAKATVCINCGDIKSGSEEIVPATHNYPDDWSVLVEPDCETKGINVKICLNCNDLITQKLPKAGHADKDGDSKCDTCNKEIIVTEPDEPIEPDTPDEPEVPEEKPCSCDCHAGGIKAFFFKLINFFAKIFDKSARVCECGKSH